jgi:hypothetical protein
VGYVVLVLILVGAGVALLTTGRRERSLIEGRRRLLTLALPGAADTSRPGSSVLDTLRLPGIASPADEVREQRATADYWQGNYPALAPARDASGTIVERNPAMLLLAANAAYRSIRIDGSDPGAMQRLEEVLGQYAELLKVAPGEFDAAYNYEIVSRVRSRLGRPAGGRGAAAREKPPAGPSPGRTTHGDPGTPASDRDSGEFKIIVPKQGDERKAQPEAGSGGARIRKG